MATRPTDTQAPQEQAEHALKALKDALAAAGITLPSLAIDHIAAVGGMVLVSLGRARPDVVQSLADVITKGAER